MEKQSDKDAYVELFYVTSNSGKLWYIAWCGSVHQSSRAKFEEETDSKSDAPAERGEWQKAL